MFYGSSSKHHGLWGSPYIWSKFGGINYVSCNKVYNLPTMFVDFTMYMHPTQIEDGTYNTWIGILKNNLEKV